jgi:hypothetical protein
MKFTRFHFHELSHDARVRRNTAVIWIAILFILWFFITLRTHPGRLEAWMDDILKLLP